MITVRQIERLWNAKGYEKLFRELTSARPEASLRLEMELGRQEPVAAMAIIRLDELSQSFVPMYGKLVCALLTSQEADGGWGDAMSTALCIRALTCGQGHGTAIDRALQYLANLQRPEGAWPMVPLRRMPADAFVSAYVLLQLGDHPAFRQTVRFADAVQWFETNEASLDSETARLWSRAQKRCRLGEPTPAADLALWS